MDGNVTLIVLLSRAQKYQVIVCLPGSVLQLVCGGILRNSSRLGSTTSAVTDKSIFSFNESKAIGAEEKPLLCV